jgi:hypothetical protein
MIIVRYDDGDPWRLDDYIAASRVLDGELDRLMREKAGIVKGMRFPQHDEFVGLSIRQFCANAQARFEGCTDFDTKRQFLLDHVEREIYNHSKVTIVGSVPVASVSPGQTKLQFRIPVCASSSVRETGSPSEFRTVVCRATSEFKTEAPRGRPGRRPWIPSGPCVDGSGLAKVFFTRAAVVGAAMCSAC